MWEGGWQEPAWWQGTRWESWHCCLIGFHGCSLGCPQKGKSEHGNAMLRRMRAAESSWDEPSPQSHRGIPGWRQGAKAKPPGKASGFYQFTTATGGASWPFARFLWLQFSPRWSLTWGLFWLQVLIAIHLIDFKENNGGRTKSPMMFLQALFISAVKVVVHSSHISPEEGIGVGGGR